MCWYIGPYGTGYSCKFDMGLLDADNGSILIDDIDVRENLKGCKKWLDTKNLIDDSIQKYSFGVDQDKKKKKKQ